MKLVNVPSLLERLGIRAKRKGREWWACCPLHEERTPSWQMRDDEEDPDRHGRWRCLGACHAGGGPIGLVMHVLGVDAREAWEWIKTGSVAERMPLAISFDDDAPDLSRFVFGFRLPLGVEFAPFFDWPRPATSYLASRGVTAEQVDRWGIGYATGGKLSQRIVFPWRDGIDGKLLGYTARAYVPISKRYLEPGEKEGAARGAVYGEEHWPPPGAREAVVVVEGAIDGLAVERATGLAFGAACGSQLLPAHASKLSTFKTIVIASDTDKAGDGLRASIVGMLGRWSKVIAVDLPMGKGGERYDPARIEVELGRDVLGDAIRSALA